MRLSLADTAASAADAVRWHDVAASCVVLVLGGCVAGINPVIAVGSQATEDGEATLGLQLGVDALVEEGLRKRLAADADAL